MFLSWTNISFLQIIIIQSLQNLQHPAMITSDSSKTMDIVKDDEHFIKSLRKQIL